MSLLVINSVSFPFHIGQNLSISARNYLLERLKQALTKACATRNLTVGDQLEYQKDTVIFDIKVVTTSQLATKILNPDGTPGTFDTGGQGVMVPQLGDLSFSFGLRRCPTSPQVPLTFRQGDHIE
jgi:RAD51-like protein 2